MNSAQYLSLWMTLFNLSVMASSAMVLAVGIALITTATPYATFTVAGGPTLQVIVGAIFSLTGLAVPVSIWRFQSVST